MKRQIVSSSLSLSSDERGLLILVLPLLRNKSLERVLKRFSPRADAQRGEAPCTSKRTFRGGGTSRYAAPEQMLTGHEARSTADIYSFGKILVFLLTGDTDIDLVHFMQWRNLIRRCTTEVEGDRPSVDE